MGGWEEVYLEDGASGGQCHEHGSKNRELIVHVAGLVDVSCLEGDLFLGWVGGWVGGLGLGG